MEMISNNHSLLGESDFCFEPLLTIKEFPIKMGVTVEPRENDICEDLSFIIDKSSGMVQLEKLVPQDILYADAHYNNVASNWKEHHQAFSQFISQYDVGAIFEIGGGYRAAL